MEIARTAADHVRRRRGELFGFAGTAHATSETVSAKTSATDPVTVADRESEDVVRSLLAQRRPGDAVLGEEGGGAASDDGVTWVVDPIDGTVNFLYGIPAYSVSVAAQVGGVSVAGAVVDVVADTVYCAARGSGATAITAAGERVALTCNPVDDLSLALVATGFAYSAARRARQGELVAALLPRVRDIRRIGSAALDLCMVASGRTDAHYEHGLSVWDWAAGALVAEEAGAAVRVPAATAPGSDGRLVVAAAPGIADELAKVFTELGTDAPIPA
ncbi:inositol monophosphatase [Rhodococcus rhodnii]|uniref:Inositol-1-monophosphatase n=1 Tax=Rhodococcus rhodnii TaxID=38312 RepID=A0A6P2CJ46_9NOCA|nr:inositol monophosphatase [Rhodococcus rhodnii]